jgi:hypothetical protein
MMPKLPKIISALLIFSIIAIASTGFANENLPPRGEPAGATGNNSTEAIVALETPSANTSVSNLVPMNIITKIAMKTAEERWGQGQVSQGDPIPCSDAAGNIVVYAIPFHIGKGPFPAREALLGSVKQGRDDMKSLEKGHMPNKVTTPVPNTSAIEHRADSVPGAEASAGAAQAAMDKAAMEQELKAAKKKAIGADEYMTIYVSATYDNYPIPLISHYLPPFFTTGDLARQKVQDKVQSATAPSLSRYYFLGRRGQYFEFNAGGNKFVIHAQSLEIESLPQAAAGKAVPDPRLMEDIRQTWDAIINR